MLRLEDNFSFAKHVRLLQLFFERKFVEKNNGKIPLNDFILDTEDMKFYPPNTREVSFTLDDYKQYDKNGYIEVINDDKS